MVRAARRSIGRRLLRKRSHRARARNEGEVFRKRRRNPGHLLAVRGAGHADAGAIERFFRHQVGNADFLEQLLNEQAVVAAIVRNHRTERRRIHHQRTVRRNHRRKAGRETSKPTFVRIAPGSIDQRNLDARAAVVDFAQDCLETDAIPPDICLGPYLGIDGYHETLAVGLDTVATEEDQRDAARLDMAVEPFERLAHSVAGQIFADLDGKAVTLEFVGNAPRIVDRLLQRRIRVGIFRVADNEGKPVGSDRGGREDRRQRKHQGDQQ